MSETASIINAFFFALLAFYVCVQVALMIFEVRTTERSYDKLPPAFTSAVSLEQHRKSIDYTAEVIQVDVMSAFLSVGLALLMTAAGGLNLLWAYTTILFGQGFLGQIILLAFILLLLVLIDIPCDWYRNFRVSERYGLERTPPRAWLVARLQDVFTGWLMSLPACALIIVLSNDTYWWWIMGFVVTALWYFWHICLYPMYAVTFAKKTTELQAGELRDRLELLLTKYGFQKTCILVMKRPENLRHDNALLVWGWRQYRLVIFDHTLQQLDTEETLAIAANSLARFLRWHTIARVVFFTTFLFLFWISLSVLAEIPAFYEALYIAPNLALSNSAMIPGLLLSIAVTLLPVTLYPLIFLMHTFTRMLEFDADAFAVKAIGAEPLIRAIVKLHRDYTNSLTPNRFYSLANHRRPHVTQRILAAIAITEKTRRHNIDTRQSRLFERAARFNAVLEARESESEAKNAALVRRERERFLEAQNLQNRTHTEVR